MWLVCLWGAVVCTLSVSHVVVDSDVECVVVVDSDVECVVVVDSDVECVVVDSDTGVLLL